MIEKAEYIVLLMKIISNTKGKVSLKTINTYIYQKDAKLDIYFAILKIAFSLYLHCGLAMFITAL